MSNYRTRYGRTDNQKKNVLITVQVGDDVFFGISRCNLEHDQFAKATGTRIATSRCDAAMNNRDVLDNAWAGKNSKTHNNGMFGVIPAKNVPELIFYFEEIDRLMDPLALNPRRPVTDGNK